MPSQSTAWARTQPSLRRSLHTPTRLRQRTMAALHAPVDLLLLAAGLPVWPASTPLASVPSPRSRQVGRRHRRRRRAERAAAPPVPGAGARLPWPGRLGRHAAVPGAVHAAPLDLRLRRAGGVWLLGVRWGRGVDEACLHVMAALCWAPIILVGLLPTALKGPPLPEPPPPPPPFFACGNVPPGQDSSSPGVHPHDILRFACSTWVCSNCSRLLPPAGLGARVLLHSLSDGARCCAVASLACLQCSRCLCRGHVQHHPRHALDWAGPKHTPGHVL